jgi:hypothetical protein
MPGQNSALGKKNPDGWDIGGLEDEEVVEELAESESVM